MGSTSISRRNFFRSLTINSNKLNELTNDPLFEKYSRKTLGPRVYSTVLTSFNESESRNTETSLRVGTVTSGITPYTGTWDAAQAIHLLKRTNFGTKKVDVDTLVAAGSASAAVDIILNINTTPPAPPIVWYNNIAADAGGLAAGADWTNNPFTTVDAATTTLQQASNSYRVDAMRRWLFSQAVNQDITIREKMTWFWYHFLPIDFNAITGASFAYGNTNSARIFYSYFKMFRDGALGNYKTLIRSLATHPCMMYYLNNQANSATAPDENFGRELMELFTLGKDPLSQYTQADVVAAAQVLTGWRVQNLNTANPITSFVSSYHKTGNKQFSSFFNNTVISNPTPTNLANGASELDALIDMIFTKQQVVSEYIVRRLYRYFVYYDIDANIEANVITPLAQFFVASNWEILPVLQKLFKSQHFFDVANKGVYIKTPFDFVIGTLKTFNITTTIPDASNYEAQYRLWAHFHDSYCLPMEQYMGSIPNVSGWNAFYQTPAFHEYWINTNTIQKRFLFLQNMANGYNQKYIQSQTTAAPYTTIKIDVIAFVTPFGNTIIADPDLLVAECIKYLLPISLSTGTGSQQEAIKGQTLLSGQAVTSNYYWTNAWNAYYLAPTNTINLNTVTTRLKNLIYTIIQLAEYQLM